MKYKIALMAFVAMSSVALAATPVLIMGTKGDDHRPGGPKDEIIRLLEGEDSSSAGLGNDKVYGGPGSDSLNGGGGDDELYSEDPAMVNGGADAVDDVNYGEGESGDDKFIGGRGYDIVAFYSHERYYDPARLGVHVDLRIQGRWQVIVPQTGEREWIENVEGTIGSGNNDVLNGNDLDNYIDGSGGSSDLIFGWGGDDTLSGSNLDGGAGDDWLAGTTFSYGTVTCGVTVDLRILDRPQNTGPCSGNDTLGGKAYNLNGSDFNDVLIGEDVNTIRSFNILNGMAGDDLIDPGAGNDTVDGGPGNDTVTYARSPIGVIVDLNSKVYNKAWGKDVILNVENVIGSAFNDTLSGVPGQPSRLTGGLGADTFITFAGNVITDFNPAQGDREIKK